MPKACAMLAVFLFSVYLGCSSSARLRNRMALLKSLTNAIKRLTDLMRYERLPLAKLLERSGEESGLFHGVAQSISAGASPADAFKDTLLRLGRQSPQYASITDGDRLALGAFFEDLGSGDLASEQERAFIAINVMEAAAKEAEAQFVTRGKLCRSLGVLAGAAAAILIL